MILTLEDAIAKVEETIALYETDIKELKSIRIQSSEIKFALLDIEDAVSDQRVFLNLLNELKTYRAGSAGRVDD